jgi:hypothetical protein
MIKTLKKEKGFLFFVFILSFILRVIFFQVFLVKNNGFFVCSDSSQYNNVALKIAQGKGIVDQDEKPTTFRVPGYSLFLAFFYKLFKNYSRAVLLIQIFLSSFIPVLLFLLSLVFFPKNVVLAKLSSIFMALNIGSILHSGLIMSDSLFLFFFIIFLISFFYGFNCFFIQKRKNNIVPIKQYSFAGLILGILSLIRPVGQFLIIVSLILIFFSNQILKNKIKLSLIFFAMWFFVVGGWLFRNYILTGNVIFHSMSGYHFLTYFAAEVETKNENIYYSEAKNNLLKEWNDFCDKNSVSSEVYKDKVASEIALKYLLKNKIQTLKHAFVNVFKTLFSLNSSYLLFCVVKDFPDYSNNTSMFKKIKRFLVPKTDNKFLIFIIYLEIIFLFFTLLGFLLNIFFSIFDQVLFCNNLKILPIIGLLIALTLGSGVARLRLPVEPLMIIFAANFYLNLFRKKFVKI